MSSFKIGGLKIQFISQNHWILFGILIVGSILRFYNYFNLPFSHDEISALLRTKMIDFDDLIENGVMKNDFHPAGVQVFLYYWTKLVGMSEWIVKLPFTLMSIASIFLAFTVGKKLRNETVGLMLASILASSQYFIIYGSFARPYSSGLFFTLLFLIAVINLILHPEKKLILNIVLFIASGSLCTYNHYLSTLVAGIIGLAGLFFVSRRIIWCYLLAGTAVALLYIPHLPITLYQLGKGGVGGENGWLGAPTPQFFNDFGGFLFHYSILSFLSFISVVIFGFFKANRDNLRKTNYLKIIFTSLILFLFPLLLSYFYSVYANPILQFSVLIFSQVFFYLFAFGHFKQLPTKKNILIVTLILLPNIFTLIQERRHFDLYYNSIYNKINDDYLLAKKYDSNMPSLVSYPNSMIEFNMNHLENFQIQSKLTDFKSNSDLLSYLDSISREKNYFYLGASDLPPNLIPQIERFFPVIVWRKDYFLGSTFLFAKGNPKIKKSSKITLWNNQNGLNYGIIDSLSDFSSAFEKPLKAILKSKTNFLDFEFTLIDLPANTDVRLVTELWDRDSLIHWSSSSSLDNQINGRCTKIIHTLELFENPSKKNTRLKVHVWNAQNRNVKFGEISIYERMRNPYLYGLIDPIRIQKP